MTEAKNAGHAFATVWVDEFARAGMTHAVVAPGSRSAPLAMALAADDRIRLHVQIDERSASFTALGIAKASRRPVALVCTSGTAAAEFHPAVIEAHHSRIPLIVLTADRPPELRNTGAGQTIDQIKLYGDSVRFFAEAGVPEARADAVRYWRSLASRAVAAAVGTPAGPVHINAAFRDPLVPVADDRGFPHPLDGRADGEPWIRVDRAPRAPSEDVVQRLAQAIDDNERGLIVAGETVARVDSVAVHALARAAGWPVIAEPQSGVRNGDGVISTAEALLHSEPFAADHRPQFVIRIGKVATSKPLLAFLSHDVPQVLIDPDAAWIDPERVAHWSIDADPTILCDEVAKAVTVTRGQSKWALSWLTAERNARDALDATLDDAPAFEGRIARDVAAGVPDATTLIVASSMPVRALEWFMRPRDLRVLTNRGVNGIDGFVSTTLGVALATDTPVVALAGDLSMLHDQNGLLLTRSEKINAVFVVINNDGGGIFSFLPQAEFTDSFEKLFGTPHGIDFAAVAKVYGCDYAVANDLSSQLESAVARGGVHLIEARTDRAENVAFYRRAWEAVARAIV
ncbi:MAG: 2-succinyl-5-enolpyruvyl-6-hydroxy-3-cyclohexene-1-carboxylic-acid synthase [Actinomycetota bacterium]|nr:2-succinyl-5-enolpyruvyl-6-hydroxy-3-cyclohexene-1-carboxylic-acid synthase [Actinomycetota bacterium]